MGLKEDIQDLDVQWVTMSLLVGVTLGGALLGPQAEGEQSLGGQCSLKEERVIDEGLRHRYLECFRGRIKILVQEGAASGGWIPEQIQYVAPQGVSAELVASAIREEVLNYSPLTTESLHRRTAEELTALRMRNE